ncbi:MAG: long-chain fatty acid--CoA ligase [Proteobacteria bacterium]|nr:long-chain fatty acid--CoA ligase [Pseudomonadota bacterium]
MNVGEWTTRWAQLKPNEPCLKYGDLELTKMEFNLRINRLAHAFQEIGVKKGDRVTVLMANSNVFLEALFALSKLGAIMVPLNFRLAAPELEFIINNSEPMTMVYSPEFLPLIEELKGQIPTVIHYICELEGGADGDLVYEPWIADKSDEEPVPDSEVILDDAQFIMYTSGTTGKPKGAVLTHGNTQWNAINSIHMYPIDSKDVAACCAPLFHIGALSVSATPQLYMGCKLVIQRAFDPVGILKLIEDNKVNSMFGIPVMFLFMSQMPDFETVDFSSVNYFLAGGSPCPKSLIEAYQAKGVNFAQGYGMTETAPGVTALLPEESLEKLGSSGKAVFHLALKIVDLKGNEVPQGETGEILVKGPNVIREYWRRPEETAKSIVDGWLFTGDMGYQDEDGYLYIKDRRKDMYISGGENVYPAEVEDAIMGFPEVADVGVIGIPDEKWGESGLAVVVKAPDVDVTEEQIIQACQGKLGKYKIPKKVAFMDELPRTLTGKILKKDLRTIYGSK